MAFPAIDGPAAEPPSSLAGPHQPPIAVYHFVIRLSGIDTHPGRETQVTQHLHQASYQHSIVSGFYQLAEGVPLDATATYRKTRPDLGAHYGRTRGTCRCGVEVIQLCVEGDTGFSNRRGWVPVADLEAAYAENAERDELAEPMSDLEAIIDEDVEREWLTKEWRVDFRAKGPDQKRFHKAFTRTLACTAEQAKARVIGVRPSMVVEILSVTEVQR